MKYLSSAFVTALLMLATYACAAKERRDIGEYEFINGYGKSIILTTRGAFIDGKFYSAKTYYVNGMECIKYGSLFAIIAPLTCNAINNYEWGGDGVLSFLMAVTPHQSNNVLLSTNYGGRASFNYEGEGGVTEIYYDPSIRIGVKEVWSSTDYVDSKNVVYKIIGKRKLFPCSNQ